MDHGGLRWTGDVSLGAWIAPRLASLGQVASVVPRGFPAYARVLHPVLDADDQPARWAQVCQVTDRTAHALMQWQSISTPRVEDGSGRAPSPGAAWEGEEPVEGSLEPAALDVLCQVLGEHTAPGMECCFALWEGFGWIRGSPAVALYGGGDVPPAFGPEVMTGPRLRHPLDRNYLLFTGALDAAAQMGRRPAQDWFEAQSPNLFWPTDRSWCVASEIDFESTLVAGSAELVAAVVANPALEAYPVDSADLLGPDSINT